MSEPDWRAMGDPLNDRLPPKRTAASMQCSHGVALNDCPDRSAHHIHPATPMQLWEQSRTEYEGDPEGRRRRYRQLMIECGHIIDTTPRCRCGECGGPLVLRCDDCGTVHSDPADEIAEVTEMITCGHPTCNAMWRDTEARGWLWYCSLPHGHDGSHRCIGASW